MLLERIEAHLRERKMTPSRFGREAVNDWKFVSQLRDGREPRAKTVDRVLRYLETQKSTGHRHR
ncbi:MAG: hypothetical protein DI637_03100 [Citromicrobium sp.]|nr:MAG: hypothetical protein DI637_03100 [Citromicrobium sp.]